MLPLVLRRWGSAAWISRKGAVRLTVRLRCQSARLISSTRASCHHAGVVDQHVEAPCPAGRLRHHLGRAVRVGEVGGDCLKLGIRTALCGEDAGALVTQTAGDGLPDAAAPAGDQRDLALKPAHDTGFPPFTSTSAPHM